MVLQIASMLMATVTHGQFSDTLLHFWIGIDT
jgi:hypothetical protein